MKTILVFFGGLLLTACAFGQTLEEARRLTENEQYEAASAIYTSLLAKDATNTTLYYYFGENLLLDEEVRRCKVQLQASGQVNWTKWAMWRHEYVVGLCHRCDSTEL